VPTAGKETVMSLSARDRQALDSIEDQLAGSDPRMASLMATFTRLTSGEEMPAREDIRAVACAGQAPAHRPDAADNTKPRLQRTPPQRPGNPAAAKRIRAAADVTAI
jgi:hypothetical protein